MKSTDQIKDIWKKKKWIIAAGIFLILEIYVVLNVLIPSFNSVFEVHKILDERQQKINSVVNWESEMRKLRKAQNRIESSMSDLLLKVPESDRISILTSFLNQAANSAGIYINRIQPSEHKVGAQQIAVPIQLKATGDYDGLGTFINNLEEAQFVIKVDQTSLYKTDLNDENIHADLLLNWIVLKEDSKTQ